MCFKRIWTLLCVSMSSCFSAEIYVSPAGSDSGTGTVNRPYRTLAKASAHAKPGDTVYLETGIYRETLAPTRSGKAGAPITFVAAQNAKPIISGCDVIDGWTKNSDGQWAASVDWDLGPGKNQVFLNGIPLIEARYPNKATYSLFEHDLSPIRFPEREVITGEAFESGKGGCWEGAYFFGHGYEAWAYQCARVASSKNGELHFDLGSLSYPWFEKPMNWGDPVRLKQGDGAGFLYGLPAFLDAPGEWSWDEGEVRLIAPNGVSQIGKSEARRRIWSLDIRQQDHIVVRRIQFTGGAISIQGNHNILENCHGIHLSHFLNFDNGYVFDGGHVAGVGVRVNGENNIIRGCLIEKTAAGGVALFGKANQVIRSVIQDVGYAGTYGACINISGEKHKVFFNTLRRAGRDCLHLNAGAKAKGGHSIMFNDISHPGMVCMDAGIFYTFGTNGKAEDGTLTRIAYNWVHDSQDHLPSPGIYLDNYCCNYLVDHNVVWNVPEDAAIRINAPSKGNQIVHNTVFNTKPIGSRTHNVFPRYNPDEDVWNNKDTYDVVLMNNLDLEEDAEKFLTDPDSLIFSLKLGVEARKSDEYVEGVTFGRSYLGAYPPGIAAWTAGHKGVATQALLESLGIAPLGRF